jgi:hypothetical protein
MQDTSERIRKALAEQLKLAFGRDLDALLSSRGRELWIIGIDPKKREMVDVCGTINPKLFDAKIRRTFANTDAGFMADAHLQHGITDVKADASSSTPSISESRKIFCTH